MTTNGTTFRRECAAAALLAAPLLTAVSSVLAPTLGGDQSGRLAAMSGTTATVSAVAFLLAQLPLLVAFLAIGHLLRARSPRLSAWGTCLGVGGAFAHTVFGGISMLELVMAADEPHRAVYAQLLAASSNGPIMLFGLLGLVGAVLGTLLLSIGLWRKAVGPRWVPPVLWAFLVVEFALSGVLPYAAYLSPILGLAAFGALAVEVHRSDLWALADEPGQSGRVTVPSATSTAGPDSSTR